MNYENIIHTNYGLQSMLGSTFVSVEGYVGAGKMTFVTSDGQRYTFSHEQDCCENVVINDIDGDLQDLVGEPLLVAEEVSNADGPKRKYADSYTWTFYKFATRKGHVVVRWLGESNGYYSEAVDLYIDWV